MANEKVAFTKRKYIPTGRTLAEHPFFPRSGEDKRIFERVSDEPMMEGKSSITHEDETGVYVDHAPEIIPEGSKLDAVRSMFKRWSGKSPRGK